MKYFKILCGFAVGALNALLGAGGGMVVVPILKSDELNQKEAQATAIAVILPLTIVSAITYLNAGHFVFKDTFNYIPFGIAGGILGAKLLPKISGKVLNIVFGLFLIWSAIRMFLK